MPLLCAGFLMAQSPPVFFNEINYRSNESQGFELLGDAGTNLSGYSVARYSSSGHMESVQYLPADDIPNEQNGKGSIWYDIDQRGSEPSGGLALISPSGEVEQYVAYGSMAQPQVYNGALDGPAAGQTPEYIGAALLGQTLQLAGAGIEYLDFIWISLPLFSPGEINPLQQILGGLIDVVGGLLGGLFLEEGNAGNPTVDTPENMPHQLVSEPVDLQVFPNPASDLLQVALPRDMAPSRQLVLFDLQGRVVHQAVLQDEDTQARLSVSHLPAGHYLLQITTSADQQRYTSTVLVR